MSKPKTYSVDVAADLMAVARTLSAPPEPRLRIIRAWDYAGRRVYGVQCGRLTLSLTWGYFRP